MAILLPQGVSDWDAVATANTAVTKTSYGTAAEAFDVYVVTDTIEIPTGASLIDRQMIKKLIIFNMPSTRGMLEVSGGTLTLTGWSSRTDAPIGRLHFGVTSESNAEKGEFLVTGASRVDIKNVVVSGGISPVFNLTSAGRCCFRAVTFDHTFSSITRYSRVNVEGILSSVIFEDCFFMCAATDGLVIGGVDTSTLRLRNPLFVNANIAVNNESGGAVTIQGATFKGHNLSVDVAQYDNRKVILRNNIGFPTWAGKIEAYAASNVGTIEMHTDVSFKAVDSAGVGISGVKLRVQDNPVVASTQTLDAGGLANVKKSYVQTTGVTGLSPSAKILIAEGIRIIAGVRVVAEQNRLRPRGRNALSSHLEATDIKDGMFLVKAFAYGYIPAAFEVNLIKGLVAGKQIALVADVNIVDSTVAATALYTGIDSASQLNDRLKAVAYTTLDAPIDLITSNKAAKTIKIKDGWSLIYDASISTSLVIDSVAKTITIKSSADNSLVADDFADTIIGAVDASLVGHTNMKYGGNSITIKGADPAATVKVYEADKVTLIETLGLGRVYLHSETTGAIYLRIEDTSDVDLFIRRNLVAGYDNEVDVSVGGAEPLTSSRFQDLVSALPDSIKDTLKNDNTNLTTNTENILIEVIKILNNQGTT